MSAAIERPRILDLFCGAGGAAEGYRRAGFAPYGIDNNPKPLRHYPFPYVCMDALEAMDRLLAGEGITFSNGETLYLRDFAAIHASPPCQAFTALKTMWNAREHPDFVSGTKERLAAAAGVPYVIENVPGSPVAGLTLCGTMFNLGTGDAELRRHRLFEVWPVLILTPPCAHYLRPRTITVLSHQGHAGKSRSVRTRVIGVYGGHGRDRRSRFNTQGFSTGQRREAMGIDWATSEELSQAIPPAYTEYIGRALWRHIGGGSVPRASVVKEGAMKRPCAKCNKEIRWNGGSYHCSACRKNLPQPDTACLRCGGNAGGNLWCGDCSRPFTDSNKRLSQQLAYNKLDKRGRERSKNPGYSNGAIPLDL